MNQADFVQLSICIVGINSTQYLRDCIHSIQEGGLDLPYEIIYVDNGSTDNTLQMLRGEFPEVATLWNPANQGYARANNQAIQLARGGLVLLLNPDTLVPAGSLSALVSYLKEHPQTGIAGPKVLNSDGSFQAHCKRGEARPWEVFCYFTGLARLFPHNPHFSGYLQSFLDEDEIHQVPAISGSCMLIRRAVLEQIGLLDERFFAYQEDTDLCVRARKAGWQVTYMPAARITHFGGKGGSGHQPYRTIFVWHQSYYRYYRKHLAQDYFFLFNWFYYLLMGLKFGLSVVINLLRAEKRPGPKRE
jgi:hypothetical protein